MKLDIKERLQLSYQLKILEKLYPEEREYYAQHRKAIEEGYELHYNWITEHLFEGLTKDDCSFVLNVLEMYSAINISFKHIDTPKEVDLKKIKFPGFDGNNETMQMAYTQYFIDDLERFTDIKESTNGYYNSHFPKIDTYKQMLEKWNNIDSQKRYKLTEQEILDIINT